MFALVLFYADRRQSVRTLAAAFVLAWRRRRRPLAQAYGFPRIGSLEQETSIWCDTRKRKGEPTGEHKHRPKPARSPRPTAKMGHFDRGLAL